MIQKDQVIQLVEELRQRSGLTYKNVAILMDCMPDVTMSDGMFHSRFRRFTERQSRYEAAEILALIQAFTDDHGIVCTPFEAILLCSWTGVGIGAMKGLRAFYDDDVFDVALTFSTQVDLDHIHWFDPQERSEIQKQLAQALAKYREKQDIARFFANNRSSQPRTRLEVTRNPPEKPSFDQFDDFERLDHQEIARLIRQSVLDIGKGRHQDAEKVLVKVVHKANPQHTPQIRDAHHNLGVIHIKRAEYARADKYLQTALRLTSDSDGAARARIFADMGANAFAQGLYPKARGHYEQGLRIARSVGARSVVAFLQDSLGSVATETQQYRQAYQHYESAQRIAREDGNMLRLAYAYKGLGSASEMIPAVCHRSKDFYLKGLGRAEDLGHTELVAQFNWLIGSLQTEQRDLLNGERALKEAAALAIDAALPALWANILITLGRSYIQEHKWNIATTTFHNAFLQITHIDNFELIAKTLYGIALAQVAQRYTIGTNDVKGTIQQLSFLRKDPSFAHVPPQAMDARFLHKAQTDFGLGLANFPNLERYRLVKALQFLFGWSQQ